MWNPDLYKKTWKGGKVTGQFGLNGKTAGTGVYFEQTDSWKTKRSFEYMTIPQFLRFAKMVESMKRAWEARVMEDVRSSQG